MTTYNDRDRVKSAKCAQPEPEKKKKKEENLKRESKMYEH